MLKGSAEMLKFVHGEGGEGGQSTVNLEETKEMENINNAFLNKFQLFIRI